MTLVGFPLKVALTIRSSSFLTDSRSGSSFELIVIETPRTEAFCSSQTAEAVKIIDVPIEHAAMSGSVSL